MTDKTENIKETVLLKTNKYKSFNYILKKNDNRKKSDDQMYFNAFL